jgi:hypothetical protein
MDAAAKNWLVSVKQLGKPDGQLGTALGYDVAAFQKQAPDLVEVVPPAWTVWRRS